MTTYSREQITEAWKKASRTTEHTSVSPGHDWIVAFVDYLGLTVEDPKPEPGVYSLDGKPVILYAESFADDRDWFVASNTSKWAERNRDKLTPARVVPAEPVELTEDDYKALWDLADNLPASVGGRPWLKAGPEARLFFRSGADAAVAKYAR